jgi:hypothetical protein
MTVEKLPLAIGRGGRCRTKQFEYTTLKFWMRSPTSATLLREIQAANCYTG